MADPATSSRAVTLSQPALESWGREVGHAVAEGRIRLPLVVALRGSLGAGKSVLARAIARGAGVMGPIPSPTYNLLFTYELDGRAVHHLDLYRLEHPDDVWELGWEELGQGEQVVLIEWPERAEALLPEDRWEVLLEPAGERLRRVRVEGRAGAPDPPRLPTAGVPGASGGEP